MLVVCWSLSIARCSLFVVVLIDVLFGGCCLLSVVCVFVCLCVCLSFVCCSLFVVRCLPLVVWCLLLVVR